MCGRYTLKSTVRQIEAGLGFDCTEVDLRPRFNIAPSQHVAVVPNAGERRLRQFRWGLVPSWAKDLSIGNRLINARAETAAEKPSYRNAFKRRRCLVIADGFYEWKREGQGKTPMYIRMRDGRPFAFAGLWESWRPAGGEELRSCTILTTTPNRLLAPIHDRMPVILPRECYDRWLNPAADDPAALRELLRPSDPDALEAYAVSSLVNSPANDRPQCIEQV